MPGTKPRLRSAAAASFVAVAILVALGVWQLHRRAWKAGILARVEAAEQAAPVPVGRGPVAPFTKIVASGRLGPEWGLYGADVHETSTAAKMGSGLLEVLHRDGAAPVLVDLGWVAEGSKPVFGPATITGYARLSEHPGPFSPPDNPQGQHFYTLDPAAIGAALGVGGLLPFTLVALGPEAIGGAEPAAGLPRPPNNHLQYAFTWFGLAGALIGIFIAYARGARQREG